LTSTPRSPLPTLAMLLFLAGCSTSPLSHVQPSGQSRGLGDDPGPGLLSATSKVVSASVNGAEGGMLRNGDWTVTLPAGCFPGTGLVTIIVPYPGSRSCDLSVVPPLPNVHTPVILSCRLQTAQEAREYRMMTWDPQSKAWKAVLSTTSATVMTCDVPPAHVSAYRCAKSG